MAAALEVKADHLLLRVRVQPKASRDAVSVQEGRVRVALTAPPVDGAANKALCAFVAKQLSVAKRSVRVASGGKSREKTLRIEGADVATVRRWLGL